MIIATSHKITAAGASKVSSVGNNDLNVKVILCKIAECQSRGRPATT